MKAGTQIFIILCMVFITLLPLNNGYALDNGNPYWPRPSDNTGATGAPFTTFQDWIFPPDPGPATPVGPTIGPFYGSGTIVANPEGPATMPPVAPPKVLPTRVFLNNFDDDKQAKWIYLQYTTINETETPIVDFPASHSVPPTTFTLLDADYNTDLTPDVIGGPFYSWEFWQLGGVPGQQNPSYETLFLETGINLSDDGIELVIDTISLDLPEPATLALLESSLALGALAKRRKAKSVS